MAEAATSWWTRVSDLAVETADGAAERLADLASNFGADGVAARLDGAAGRWTVVVAILLAALGLVVAVRRVGMRRRGPAAVTADNAAALNVARKWDDTDFVSVVQGELSHRRHRAASLLLAIVVGFFVVAVLWADWAVLDEVTTGSGKVIPSSQLQVVQNLEGGIIKEILVREGQVVQKGEILLRIDDTGFAATYGETRAKRFAIEAAIVRLKAEIEGRPLEFPKALAEARPDLVQAERTLFRLRKEELRSQVDILRQQASQRRQELVELKSRLRQLQRSYDLANEELAMTRPLIKEGAISRVEVLRLEREVNDLKGGLDGTRLQIPRAEAALAETQRRIEEKYAAFRAEAQRELGDRYASLAVVEETSAAAKDRVTRTEVRSPVHGTIKRLMVTTIGGVVKPGMDLVEIVPLEDTLLVEARIRPTDIAFLRPGQAATVKITAYDFSIYGGLQARLEHISADTITDERGNSFFQIRVRTDRSYLGTDDKPLPIIPGMTATVDILTGRKTVLDYLLKPILKVRDRALRER